MNYKCVFIGNVGVGKTSIIRSLANKNIHNHDDLANMSIFDNYCVDKKIDGRDIHFSLWDTSANKDHYRIRKLSYPQTNCFVVCYAIDNKESYNAIPNWVREISEYECDMVLLANKVDLRYDNDTEEQVTYNMGVEMCLQHNFKAFVECSSVTSQNIELIFEKILIKKRDERGWCEYLCNCCY
ncbi:Ras-related protein ced-10 [Dictyocoela muelleri]|nr:Ras-related protein ced-10 [Dictyocoela muelleri]